MAVHLDRTGGSVEVTDRGREAGSFPSVEIHGCDASVAGRGSIAVYGVESAWEDGRGVLHLSDNKRAGPEGSRGGLGGLGL